MRKTSIGRLCSGMNVGGPVLGNRSARGATSSPEAFCLTVLIFLGGERRRASAIVLLVGLTAMADVQNEDKQSGGFISVDDPYRTYPQRSTACQWPVKELPCCGFVGQAFKSTSDPREQSTVLTVKLLVGSSCLG